MSLKISVLVVLFLLNLYCSAQIPEGKDDPIIGILTLPAEGWDGYNSTQWNYFASSYVKFIEAAGAQVVPIHWDYPLDQIEALLGKVNGVFFTGGGTGMGNATRTKPIYGVYQFIVNYVLQKNKNGTYYPLWGTCLGFEGIARVLANNISLLSPCKNCLYVNKNNYLVPNYDSRILKNLTQDLLDAVTTGNISLFDHSNMLTPQSIAENPTLAGNISVVTYSMDSESTKYVGIYESPNLPIYGTQFHQEKANFEWKPNLGIFHGYEAVRFSQYLANFFVRETRKNNISFPDNSTYLIYNYRTSVVPDCNFTEMYLFPTYNTTLQSKKPHHLTMAELNKLNEGRMPEGESFDGKTSQTAIQEKQGWLGYLKNLGGGFLRRINQ